MIRTQQLELQQLQARQGHGVTAAEESAIASERSAGGSSLPSSIPQTAALPSVPAGAFARSPGLPGHPRGSFDISRGDLQRRSRTPSRGASPGLRSTSISGDSDHIVANSRDESAFYQAETQMLTRENQMLRHRIRDLGKCPPKIVRSCAGLTISERQLSETNAISQVTHEPSSHSHLSRTQSVDEVSRGTTPSNSGAPGPGSELAKVEG